MTTHSIKISSIGIIFLVISGLFFASCEKAPNINTEMPPLNIIKGGMFVLNEGNFQFGNASLDYFDFESQKYSSDIFETVNNRKLGDVLQSMTHYGDICYLVVNISQNIEIIDLTTLKVNATINGFVSPRFMRIKNYNQAYVSEYYGGGVKLVDLHQQAILHTIPIRGNCDDLIFVGNKLYVTNANSTMLYVINTNTNLVQDSIEVGYGSNSLQVDAQNRLWVLCAGMELGTQLKQGRLVSINTDVDTILTSFEVKRNSDHGPIKLRINSAKTMLYWINKHIFKHQVNDAVFNQEIFLPSVQNNFWALSYDSLKKEIYVGDAINYMQRRSVSRYSENTEIRGTFKAGIICSDFYFYHKQ